MSETLDDFKVNWNQAISTSKQMCAAFKKEVVVPKLVPQVVFKTLQNTATEKQSFQRRTDFELQNQEKKNCSIV